jgi:preprotein translocase subunit YajC
MFISEAFAQSSGAAGAGGFSMDTLTGMLPIVGMFVVIYFFMIRPQQKKMKAQREMVSALRRGDRVLLQGGMFGQVAKAVGDNELMVEIADKVQVKVLRSAVAEVLEKTQPVSSTEDDKAAKAE